MNIIEDKFKSLVRSGLLRISFVRDGKAYFSSRFGDEYHFSFNYKMIEFEKNFDYIYLDFVSLKIKGDEISIYQEYSHR